MGLCINVKTEGTRLLSITFQLVPSHLYRQKQTCRQVYKATPELTVTFFFIYKPLLPSICCNRGEGAENVRFTAFGQWSSDQPQMVLAKICYGATLLFNLFASNYSAKCQILVLEAAILPAAFSCSGTQAPPLCAISDPRVSFKVRTDKAKIPVAFCWLGVILALSCRTFSQSS